MESFCIDGLHFNNFDLAIHFNKQRPMIKKYLHISFLNVPAEVDQDKMT